MGGLEKRHRFTDATSLAAGYYPLENVFAATLSAGIVGIADEVNRCPGLANLGNDDFILETPSGLQIVNSNLKTSLGSLSPSLNQPIAAIILAGNSAVTDTNRCQ